MDSLRILPATCQSVTVSIVSHGHGLMVPKLLESVLKCDEVRQVLLTLNIPETLELPSDERLQIIRNEKSKGFYNWKKVRRTRRFRIASPEAAGG